MKKINRFALLAIVVIAAILLCGCGNNADAFEQYVRDGNYLDAIDCYYEFMGDAVEEIKAKRFLESYLDESMKAYAVAEEMSEEDIEVVLSTVSKIDEKLYILGEILYAAQFDYEQILYSRSCFAQAEAYMEAEDYLAAAEQYEMVLPVDQLNYQAAQNGIQAATVAHQEQTIQQMKDFLEDDDFEAALALTGDSVLLEENIELENTIIGGAIDKIKQILSQDEVDYLEALEIATLVLELYPDNIDLQDGLWDLEEEYAWAAYDEAWALFEESGDYESAARILEMCAANLHEETYIQEDLDIEIEYFYSFAPQGLLDIPAWYNESGEIFYSRKEIKDNKGNTYEGYYVAESLNYSWDTLYNGTSVFETDGVYDVLYGRVIISEDDKDKTDCGYVKIYGNGTLIWESGTMGKGSDPKDFSLDISGYTDITIKFQEGESYNGNCYLVDTYFQKSPEMAKEEPPAAEAAPVPATVLDIVLRDKEDTYCNFRTGPGFDYDIICQIPNGSWASKTDVPSEGYWSCVEYNGQTGWLTTVFIYDWEVYIEDPNDTYVNFRSGPGGDYSVIAEIPNGSWATAVNELDKGEWCCVNYDGTVGWVYSDFVF